MTSGIVNLAVCGKFHVLNHCHFLDARGVLNALFVSTRRASAELRLEQAPVVNAFLKEYLIQGHSRILGDRMIEAAIPLYHSLWSRSALRNWSPAPIFHFLSQGACLPLIDRARADGARLLAEVVNTHPHHRHKLIAAERDYWGLPRSAVKVHRREESLLEEVAQADFVLAPTAVVEKSYRDLGLDKPVFRIPYCANLRRFVPRAHYKTLSTGMSIISVGRIGLRKGQLYLLQALERLGNPDIKLTLVGTVDPEVAPLLAQYEHLFTHHVRVPSAKMPALLASHDVSVHASVEEGLAVSICEAMATGLYVIATEESGAAELLSTGKSGILVPSRDPAALAEAIEGAYADPEHRGRTGVTAAAETQRLHNWRDYADRLIKVYDIIMAKL